MKLAILLPILSFLLATLHTGHAQSVTSWKVCSEATNKSPRDSPLALYSMEFFKETGTALGGRLQPKPFGGGIIDTTLLSFKKCQIRIPYQMNSERKIEFYEAISEPNAPKNQINIARDAMKQGAKKLKPFSPELKAVVGESFKDTMVFVFQ